ncbi:MAG TPA: hypothetical protein PLE10_09845 [Brevefilum sp.]|nr:hypothetical protein [Brevefilum sp.]HOR20109.1 hypothetical protein [Brevefilum sp.]HPL69220.1 hypothetical protein [Brevefilum sp.]
MEIGLLWFDNNPKLGLHEKVVGAAAYYQRKYRQQPNLCFVHPSMIPDAGVQAGSILIRSNLMIRPDHFWIGIAEEEELATCQAHKKSG